MRGSVPPELLSAKHQLGDFDCGDPGLNDWLASFALREAVSERARTYVTHRGDLVVTAYYTLAVGSVALGEATGRVSKGAARSRPIGVAILARLAVDRAEQDRGLGSGLVRDALVRVAQAGDIIGIRAVLVHMKTPELRAFHERFDFEPSPVDERQMFLLMKDLRRAITT